MVSSPRFDKLGLSLVPFQVHLKEKGWGTRQTLVKSIYKNQQAGAKKYLPSLLSDPDERVRLLTAQALERIHERSLKEIQKLRVDIKNNPTDLALREKISHLLCQFAEASKEMVETKRHLYEEAEIHLTVALKQKSTASHLWLQLAGVMSELGKIEKAFDTLSWIRPSDKEYPQGKFLEAELFLKKGDPLKCKALLKQIKDLPLPRKMREVAAFWAE